MKFAYKLIDMTEWVIYVYETSYIGQWSRFLRFKRFKFWWRTFIRRYILILTWAEKALYALKNIFTPKNSSFKLKGCYLIEFWIISILGITHYYHNFDKYFINVFLHTDKLETLLHHKIVNCNWSLVKFSRLLKKSADNIAHNIQTSKTCTYIYN